jgi:hypothetical protein
LTILGALVFVGKREIGLLSGNRWLTIAGLVEISIVYALCFAATNWRQVGFLRNEIRNIA